MNHYVISLGSNVDKAREAVECAIARLSTLLDQFKQSGIYSTPSVSGDGTFYCNAVVSGFSSLSPEEMSALCKDYERQCGREPMAHTAVVIDLDVVICNDEVLRPKDFARSYFTIGFSQLS